MIRDYIRDGQLGDELWDAIEEDNDVEKVAKLIKQGVDVNGNSEAFFEEGMTYLVIAALSGNLEIVKLLVESGADVNAKCDYGDTALYNAISSGHQQIAEYLKPFTNPEIKAEVERYIETEKR